MGMDSAQKTRVRLPTDKLFSLHDIAQTWWKLSVCSFLKIFAPPLKKIFHTRAHDDAFWRDVNSRIFSSKMFPTQSCNFFTRAFTSGGEAAFASFYDLFLQTNSGGNFLKISDTTLDRFVARDWRLTFVKSTIDSFLKYFLRRTTFFRQNFIEEDDSAGAYFSKRGTSYLMIFNDCFSWENIFSRISCNV